MGVVPIAGSGTNGAVGSLRDECHDRLMSLIRIAPIFAVHDLDASMAFYRELGFATRAYERGGYGFATCDGTELHLGVVPAKDDCNNSAYLYVEDANEVAHQWRSVGVEIHGPEDTEWKQHEGAVRDPDGNVIRFGSPVRR